MYLLTGQGKISSAEDLACNAVRTQGLFYQWHGAPLPCPAEISFGVANRAPPTAPLYVCKGLNPLMGALCAPHEIFMLDAQTRCPFEIV